MPQQRSEPGAATEHSCSRACAGATREAHVWQLKEALEKCGIQVAKGEQDQAQIFCPDTPNF